MSHCVVAWIFVNGKWYMACACKMLYQVQRAHSSIHAQIPMLICNKGQFYCN